jgi:phosphoribosylformimino-5-aminoimidazole carboxamide ribotide isomerase
MRILVAIDILDGKCVRLTKGDFSTRKIYNEDPFEVARLIEDNRLNYIHLVDLDGARSGRIVNYKIIEKIVNGTSLIVDFGGGIRSDEDVRAAFEYGASQVTCGSISLTDSALFLEILSKWGPGKIILGADCKERKIATEGWSENSEIDITKFISGYRSNGVENVICTDIEKDGMLKGPSLELYREILEIPGLNLIASGGVSSIKDIGELSEAGCEGAIVGKSLYEGILNLKELGSYAEKENNSLP